MLLENFLQRLVKRPDHPLSLHEKHDKLWETHHLKSAPLTTKARNHSLQGLPQSLLRNPAKSQLSSQQYHPPPT